jgi:quinoprotein dehydrogenase-associated probable ABC transporter substrate-binding protein
MSSRFPDGGRWPLAGLASVALCAAALPLARATVPPPERPALRVCADPNNLPFSNRRGEGFENRIAELLARDMGLPLEYTWWPQRRGFIRNTLNAGRCDLVTGVPAGFDPVRTTRPYYRSTYVFVTRRDRGLRIRSLDDPVLHRVKVGIHLIGDDYANPPPAEALARRGIIRNVVGYSIYGDYSRPDPPADLVRAVAKGDVDVAIVWGPLAGYFARHVSTPLDLTPVKPAVDGALPFVFEIAMGVRRGDSAAAARLERELARRRPEIRKILRAYGVPVVERGPEGVGR